MTPTEYLRQVPIRHHIQRYGVDRNSGALPVWGWEITGYKQQRAWALDIPGGRKIAIMPEDREALLMRGAEVEGFEWIDLPVKE